MFDFSNATLLSYNHKSDFLGNNVFNFRTTKELSVQGLVLTLNNTEGVGGVWQGMSGLITGDADYDDIILNGENFGKGRVNSLSFRESNDVRYKIYTANVIVWTSGDMSNMVTSDGYYSGLVPSGFWPMENMAESFSFNQKGARTAGYTHTVSLKARSGYVGDPIAFAQSVASGMFAANNLTGLLGRYTGVVPKRTRRENYNLITRDCSFEERVELDLESTGNWSVIYTDSLRIDENGIAVIGEKGTVKGLAYPASGAAVSGYRAEYPKIYDRCLAVFEAYAPTGSMYPMGSTPIGKEIGFNPSIGSIDYSITYTNDPRISGTFSWEYTHKVERNENGAMQVSQDGTIMGFGRALVNKFGNALSGWNGISGQVSGMVQSYYANVVDVVRPIYLISQGDSRSEYEGTIQYSRVYSDDPSLIPSGNIRKTDISISDEKPVQMASKYEILNVGEIMQGATNPTIGKVKAKVALMGSRSATLANFLSYAKTIAGRFIPSVVDMDVFLGGAFYSWNSGERRFELNAEWNYFSGFYSGSLNPLGITQL